MDFLEDECVIHSLKCRIITNLYVTSACNVNTSHLFFFLSEVAALLSVLSQRVLLDAVKTAINKRHQCLQNLTQVRFKSARCPFGATMKSANVDPSCQCKKEVRLKG